MEEGTETELPPYEFGVVVGEPVRFRFFGSSVRREDEVGTRLDHWNPQDIEELDEIEVILPLEGHEAGEVVPVQLCAAITEVGTLKLEAVAKEGGKRWKIEFDVRARDETPRPSSTGTATPSTPQQPTTVAALSTSEEAETSAVANDELVQEQDSEEPQPEPETEQQEQSSSKRFWSFKNS